MSKTEILAELPKLAPPERQEILDRLWDLEELDVLCAQAPSPDERALLDQALADYRRDPHAGRPWREVLTRLRAGSAP
jgi:hypothetical protein